MNELGKGCAALGCLFLSVGMVLLAFGIVGLFLITFA